MESNRHIRLVVSGRVQGVFYRASTEEIAIKLGLVGYVRNLPDGSVEIDAQGGKEAVKALYEWAQHGPRSARVEEVKLTELAHDNALTEFSVRH